MLPASNAGDSQETAGVNSEEGGDDVKSSCPLCPGLQTRYNGRYRGCDPVRVSESHKAGLSSDWSLQLDSMKPELLVIPDQHAGVNTFPGLVPPPVTPRKSATPEAGGPTRKREPSKVGSVIGVKS